MKTNENDVGPGARRTRPASEGTLTREGTAQARVERRRQVEQIAARQCGVVSRAQAYATGLSRHEVTASVRAGRWQKVHRQSIAVQSGPLDQRAQEWAAVFEAGPRAVLDGASSLMAGGLAHFTVDRIRVSVPRGARIRRGKNLDIRQTRRWDPGDRTGAGVPRTRNEVAAVRGALWAVSDKQAALLVTMAVQQRLASPEAVAAELLRVKKHRRRSFLNSVVLDLLDGVRSLGELDFARECRDRGIPEPSRQSLRKGRNGTYFLDVCWDRWRVVVEIDGIQHSWANQVVGDALRQNEITLGGCSVLRLPLLGLRVAPDDFFAQIVAALRAAGCSI